MNNEAAAVDSAPKFAVITAELKRAVRTASSVSFRFVRCGTNSWDRDTHSVDIFITTKEDGAKSQRVFVGFRGRIANGHKSRTTAYAGSFGTSVEYMREADNVFEPTSGIWSFITADFDSTLQTGLATVPTGAEVTFEVLLDEGSNGYCAKAGIHADHFCVSWREGKKEIVRRIILDTSTCEHNTARFGVRD